VATRLWPILLPVLAAAHACEPADAGAGGGAAPAEATEAAAADAPLWFDASIPDAMAAGRWNPAPYRGPRLVPAGSIEKGPALRTLARAGARSGAGPGHAVDCLVVTWGADPDAATLAVPAGP
jgi:hypothetical protein